MSDMNKWIGLGRVTRDAELKYTNSGTAVLNFSIAVNRSIPPRDGGEWKNEASFFDVQVWGKLAESKSQVLKKGKQVGIVAELRQDRWEQDGNQRQKIYLVAESIQPLAEARNAASTRQETATPEAASDDDWNWQPPKREAAAPAKQAQPAADEQLFDDDIPF